MLTSTKLSTKTRYPDYFFIRGKEHIDPVSCVEVKSQVLVTLTPVCPPAGVWHPAGEQEANRAVNQLTE